VGKTFAGVAFLLTQVSEDRLYVGAGQTRIHIAGKSYSSVI
jgi:hypothetical protein